MKVENLFESIDEIEDIIRQSDYRNEFDLRLYKGTRQSVNGATIFKYQMRSAPRDTWIPFHEYVNEGAMSKVGVPVRNLLFVSNDHTQAETYGEVYMAVPIGNFRLFYAKGYVDMTNNIDMSKESLVKRISTLLMDDVTDALSISPDALDSIAALPSETIKACISESAQYDIDNAFNYMVKTFVRKISDLLPEGKHSVGEVTEKVRGEFMRLKAQYKDQLDHYIQSLVEIKSKEDVSNHSGEIMVYSDDRLALIDLMDYEML